MLTKNIFHKFLHEKYFIKTLEDEITAEHNARLESNPFYMLPLAFFLIKASYSQRQLQTTTNIKHVIRFYDALENIQIPIRKYYDIRPV